MVDAHGYPVRLHFTGGNINDCKVAKDVLSPVDISGSIVMGDKAYQRQILLTLGTVIGGSTKKDI